MNGNNNFNYTTPYNQIHDRTSPVSTTSPAPISSTKSIKYKEMLSRMCYFHFSIFIFGIGFIYNSFNNTLKNLDQGTAPPKTSSPDIFTLDLTIINFVLLMIWIIFTWWGWVSIQLQEEFHSSIETQLSEQNNNDEKKQKTHGLSFHLDNSTSSNISPMFHKNIIFTVGKIEEGEENEQDIHVLSSTSQPLAFSSIASLRGSNSMRPLASSPSLESAIEMQTNSADDSPENDL